MGRYTTVQAYADNNANMRSVSYDQASGSAEGKKGLVKAEKVDNPYGSTAGAGSGEFHVYRHARSREMARWKQLDEDEKQKLLDEEYAKKVEEYTKEEEQKTARRRKKRQRQKEAKKRKQNLERAGIVAPSVDDSKEDDGEEFKYVPVNSCSDGKEDITKDLPEAPKIEIANDGSFLEQMKRQLAEESGRDKSNNAEEPPAKKRATEN